MTMRTLEDLDLRGLMRPTRADAPPAAPARRPATRPAPADPRVALTADQVAANETPARRESRPKGGDWREYRPDGTVRNHGHDACLDFLAARKAKVADAVIPEVRT